MKKQTIKAVLLLLAMIVTAITVYPFFKKTYLKYELIYAYPEGGGPYRYDYGMDYEFYHSNQSMEHSQFLKSFTIPFSPNRPGTPKKIQDKGSLFHSFDFEEYSYVAFNAQKVTSMYYSYKTTYFNDRSSPVVSCRKRGKKCVFVTYDPNSVHGWYIYRVKRDPLLRGFGFNG